jgi:hypothetical protein
VIALFVLIGAQGRADARHVQFLGAHPIASKYGGGFCYIEAPHVHAYAPDHVGLYQQVGDEFVFTGDPTPFGYEGERHPFYGNHPVVSVNGEPVYCFINGPHIHPFAAPESPEYKLKNGVAFYVGPFDPVYARMRPHRVKVVNAEYRPFVGFRPTVEVEPPSEWHGEVWVDAPAAPSVTVQAPGIAFGAPGVVVNAPAPPSVVVNAPAPPHVVVRAPRPPGVYMEAPRVEIGVPAPPSVVVTSPGVYVGGPAVYAGGPGRVRRGGHEDNDDQGEHHDNGKHKGWYKHGRGD